MGLLPATARGAVDDARDDDKSILPTGFDEELVRELPVTVTPTWYLW